MPKISNQDSLFPIVKSQIEIENCSQKHNFHYHTNRFMGKILFSLVSAMLSLNVAVAQHEHAPTAENLPLVEGVESQPLLAQATRLSEALTFLGSSLSPADADRLLALKDKPNSPEISKQIQQILDPYCLFMVDINPEARVKVLRGPAP